MTKILVVEDEEDVIRVVDLTLMSEGYEIIEAVHGLMGYSKAVSEQPHLILINFKMPVMDGLEALNKLKGNPETAKIPVIMLTSRIDAASERQCKQAGAVDYIRKPWGQQELEDRVATALNHTGGQDRESRVSDAGPDDLNGELRVGNNEPGRTGRGYCVKYFHLGEQGQEYHLIKFRLEDEGRR